MVVTRALRNLTAIAVLVLATTLTAADGKVRIVQTNSAGDNVHLIDPATNKVVGEIKDIEVNHGAAAAPDGSRLYFTNEAEHTLDFVDAKTLKVTKRVPLSGRPNNVSISKDGRRVYVAIAQAPGAVDVIDTASQTLAKTIPIEGAGHNTYVTPDGKFVVAGSVAGRTLTVDRQQDRGDLLGDEVQRRRSADHLRDQPRRLDETDVRPDFRLSWIRRRRLRDAPGTVARDAAGSARGDQEHQRSGIAFSRHRRLRQTERRCGRPASGITSWRPFRCRTSSPSASSRSATTPTGSRSARTARPSMWRVRVRISSARLT